MRIARITTAMLATAAGALLLTGCGGSPSPVESVTTSTSTTAPTTSVVTTPSTIAPPTPDPAVAEAARVAAEAEAARVAAEQEAARVAAQSVADQSAADQAEADRIASEAAADQAAADQSAADQASGVNGWYTPSGNWVSPETAARAMATGIAPGETVPNYLRCGTICGEGPTSSEVQVANACKSGLMSAAECVGIDPDAIISAASGYSSW